MAEGIGLLVTAFIITFIVVKALKPVAFVLDLVDKPGGRKLHEGIVPLIGGLAIYAGVFLSAYLFVKQPIFIRLFMLAGGLIVFLGALDDRYHLSARSRLIGQFLISCIFVYGLDVYLANFGNLFGLGDFSLGWLGYPLTVLSLMGAINAFNMLDGMDGIVGCLGMVTFIGLMYLFGTNGFGTYQILCMAFIGATAAFLIFNIWGSETRSFKKVFMGDAGSMYIGLALAVLVIQGSQGEAPAFKPITALWFVLLPMTDMFTIMYRRLRRGRSPMAPDRTHIHHILIRAGFSRTQTLYTIVAVHSVLVFVGVLCSMTPCAEWLSFAGILVFVAFYQLLMKRSWRFVRWNKRRFATA